MTTIEKNDPETLSPSRDVTVNRELLPFDSNNRPKFPGGGVIWNGRATFSARTTARVAVVRWRIIQALARSARLAKRMKQNFQLHSLDASAGIAKTGPSSEGTAPARAESLQIESMPPEVSVVMPCLNESLTVGTCIQKALATFKSRGISGEVIVADNGSTDGSQAIAIEFGARVVPVQTKGYGSALRAGIAAARGKLVVMGDSDDSYDFTQLGDFVNKLNEGFDLVMGNRFQGEIRSGAMPRLHRYLGNPVLSWLGRLFFKCPVGDSQCGLRGLRKEAIDRLQLRTLGMEFASEMLVKATLFDLRIAEIPTTLSPDGRDRAPHLRTWRDGWRHLRFFLLYSPRWLFLYPGVALFLMGIALCAWLLPQPRMVGGVTFDSGTLLFGAMAILIGFQSANFAAFSKTFAISEGLLPEDPRMNRMYRYVTLEVGLIVGALLILTGAGMWIFGLNYWRSHHFGPLDPDTAFRIVIPAFVSLILGIQIVLSSFFLSVLGMARR